MLPDTHTSEEYYSSGKCYSSEACGGLWLLAESKQLHCSPQSRSSDHQQEEQEEEQKEQEEQEEQKEQEEEQEE